MAASEGGDGPSPRFWQHSFEYEGKVYIRGGRTANFEEERGRLEATFECFDPIHKTWQQIETTGTPHPGLTQAACVCVNGIFYIYGSCERKVLSQLDLKTMVWSRLWEGSEKDDGKVPMSKAAGGMIHLKGGYLGLFGGYARPTGTLQPGSKWTPNPYEKEKGWTNEFHLFNINERVWLTPVIRGQRPPPCSDFALNGITETTAVLFGGYQHNGLQKQLYTIDFDPTSLEVTFTLKEETKPWPVGRECHTSCCIGLGTDHPQMLISGGKNMRDIALKFDMWMLDVKSFKWKKIKLPPSTTKRSPRYAHSMTTVIPYPGLESVVIFGGSPAEFTGKWTTPEFPKLTEMLIYSFGNHESEWTLLDEEKLQNVIHVSSIPELTLYAMDDRFSMKSLFSLEKVHGIKLLSGLTEKFKDFQLEMEDDQPDTISAISKWLHRSSSSKGKEEPTWQNLVSILRRIDRGSLANKVESFIEQSATQGIGDLISMNHHLSEDLWTSCEQMLEIGNSLRKDTQYYMRHTAYTMNMMKWKYEKDIARLKEEIKEMEESQDDDVVETDGRGDKKNANAEGKASTKAPLVKQGRMDEFAPGIHESHKIKKHGDSTIKKEMSQSSIKSEPPDDAEMEIASAGPDVKGTEKTFTKVTLRPVKQDALECMDDIATSAHEFQSRQRVKELEEQLMMLEEHKDTTIKLLRRKNERLKNQRSLTASESLPLTVSEPANDVEMETGDAGSRKVSPVSNGGGFQLDGVDVCGETSLVVTNSAQVFEWEGYGLKLSIPDGSLPKEYAFCTIKIIASLSGQYKFPTDCQLVSAVFWFRCEPMCIFEKLITVEMEHCADANLDSTSNLCFVRAQCKDVTPPYTFGKIVGGNFDIGAKQLFGTIDLKEFCGIGQCHCNSKGPTNATNGVDLHVKRKYCARIYHFNLNEGENTSYEVDFVVTWDIEAKRTAVRKEYEGRNAILGLEQVIKFVRDSVTIDIPMEGITKEGWEVIPLCQPVVVKETVDDYEEGATVPKCQFSATFRRNNIDEDDIPTLQHQTKLLGAKFPDESDLISFNITPPRIPSGYRKRFYSVPDAATQAKRPKIGLPQSKSLEVQGTSSQYYDNNSEQEMENGSRLIFTEDSTTMPISSNLCPNSQNIHVLKWKNAEGKTERLRIVSEISYKWEDFGGVLGIPWSQLQCWNKDYKDSKQCCIAVLNYWLKNPTKEYPVTWDSLCELLEDCDFTEIAVKLRKATDRI